MGLLKPGKDCQSYENHLWLEPQNAVGVLSSAPSPQQRLIQADYSVFVLFSPDFSASLSFCFPLSSPASSQALVLPPGALGAGNACSARGTGSLAAPWGGSPRTVSSSALSLLSPQHQSPGLCLHQDIKGSSRSNWGFCLTFFPNPAPAVFLTSANIPLTQAGETTDARGILDSSFPRTSHPIPLSGIRPALPSECIRNRPFTSQSSTATHLPWAPRQSPGQSPCPWGLSPAQPPQPSC